MPQPSNSGKTPGNSGKPHPGSGSSKEQPVFDDEAAQQFLDAVLDEEVEKRLWLRAITPLLQLRARDSDPSGRVQLALDFMYIAACERVARILSSDLPAIPKR